MWNIQPAIEVIRTTEALSPASGIASDRITSASEVSSYARKPFLQLEQLYFSDGLTFNITNTWTEMICSPGYRIDGLDEDARKYIEDWLVSIDFEDTKLPKITQHAILYGNAFCEIIFNEKGDMIVDLSEPLDPKSIDFKRGNSGYPLLDPYGNPVAYVQNGVYNQKTGKSFIEIPSEQMAHFRLYTLGASQLGIGIIEPIYWTSIGKRSIDEKIAQQEFRRATPFVMAKIGDINHPPSAEEINKVHDALKNITYKTDFVGPYWYDIDFKSSDGSNTSLNSASYFVGQEVAGSGLPTAYALGTGENQNRMVLDLIVSLTEKKTERYQKNISNLMEKIFKRKVEMKFGKGKKSPKMLWNSFSQESLDKKIDRLVKEIQVGLLQPDDDLKKVIRQLEGYPTNVKTDEYLHKSDSNAPAKK
jgi:hypothetical protein